jgi:hypothetical protein
MGAIIRLAKINTHMFFKSSFLMQFIITKKLVKRLKITIIGTVSFIGIIVNKKGIEIKAKPKLVRPWKKPAIITTIIPIETFIIILLVLIIYFLFVLFKYIFKQILGQIAHNVPGIRRFCGCDKGNRRFPATAKMCRRKNAQRGFSPDCVFS